MYLFLGVGDVPIPNAMSAGGLVELDEVPAVPVIGCGEQTLAPRRRV